MILINLQNPWMCCTVIIETRNPIYNIIFLYNSGHNSPLRANWMLGSPTLNCKQRWWGPLDVVGFQHWNYHNKSVATQAPHNAGLTADPIQQLKIPTQISAASHSTSSKECILNPMTKGMGPLHNITELMMFFLSLSQVKKTNTRWSGEDHKMLNMREKFWNKKWWKQIH